MRRRVQRPRGSLFDFKIILSAPIDGKAKRRYKSIRLYARGVVFRTQNRFIISLNRCSIYCTRDVVLWIVSNWCPIQMNVVLIVLMKPRRAIGLRRIVMISLVLRVQRKAHCFFGVLGHQTFQVHNSSHAVDILQRRTFFFAIYTVSGNIVSFYCSLTNF